MFKNLFGALLCLLCSISVSAQNNKGGNSILWKVSGNGLKQPSYLFGTFHLLTNSFIDTIPVVLDAYRSSSAVVGELIIDSSMQGAIVKATRLEKTTLKQLLPDTLYTKTSAWFKEEAGLDISQLDGLNPMTVLSAAMSITHQKYFPNKPGEIQLDSYFQEKAKKDGKKIMGLENIGDQMKALFGNLSLDRQVTILNEAMLQKNGLRSMIGIMNTAYINNDMHALQELMYGDSYKPEELKVLLDDRNNSWMKQLPSMIKTQPLFVAVGALHLVGQTGLVNQLRQMGYTLTPVKLR